MIWKHGWIVMVVIVLAIILLTLRGLFGLI
jgi:hypothetical protein